MMELFFDDRDRPTRPGRGGRTFDWLAEVVAKPLSQAKAQSAGFLFAGCRPIDDYRRLVAGHPTIADRPQDRQPLLRLNDVLDAMQRAKVEVPAPRTWRMPLDAAIPADLKFPLFVRTDVSSWKLGGRISKVRSASQLESEMFELRRALGWDSLILLREWLDLKPTGRSMYGPVPLEIRTWIVDQAPFAWSFHCTNVVPDPSGFPLSLADLGSLRELSGRVAAAFTSRLVVADFAMTTGGNWVFIEAGPGSCAGTAHEPVFKAVASRLVGRDLAIEGEKLGGLFVPP